MVRHRSRVQTERQERALLNEVALLTLSADGRYLDRVLRRDISSLLVLRAEEKGN
jgi:hypothetical protein